MADNDLNLTQYLLENPLYNYGGKIRDQGSQTTPVRTWQEGLARALQGGVGGAFQSYAGLQAKNERSLDQQALQNATQAAGKGDWEGARAHLASRPNTAGQAWQLAMQDAALNKQMELAKFNQGLQQQTGANILDSMGMPGTQGGAPQGGQAAPDPNNLGNLRPVGSNTGFQSFPTPQAGANAMSGNLGSYVQQNPNMTVAQAINKWAPPSENNTGAYVKNLSEDTGINPGMPLGDVMKDPAQAARLMEGITKIEKGGVPQGVNADTFMRAAQSPGTPPQGQPAPQAQGQLPPGFTQYNGMPVHAGTFQMGVATVRAGKIDEGTKLIQKSLEMGSDATTKPQLEEVPDTEHPGQTKRVPSWMAAGQQAGHYQAPGTKEWANNILLQSKDTSTPEYHQAWNIYNQPTLGQGGQYIVPDTSALRPPTGAGGAAKPPQVQMSPEGRLKAESDLAAEHNKNEVVQNVKTMEPWLTSIDNAMKTPGALGDKAIVNAYYRLMNPGTDRPQGASAEEAYTNLGSLPEELKKKFHGVLQGKQFLTPEERTQMRDQAYASFNSFKGPYDRAVENMRKRATEAGLSADNVIGAPLTARPSETPLAPPATVLQFKP